MLIYLASDFCKPEDTISESMEKAAKEATVRSFNIATQFVPIGFKNK